MLPKGYEYIIYGELIMYAATSKLILIGCLCF